MRYFLILLLAAPATLALVQHINCTDGIHYQSTCFTLPESCESSNNMIGNCKYLVRFTPMTSINPPRVRVELETQIDYPSVGQYIALGLSYDNKMGNDSVMACVLLANSNKPMVVLSYNSVDINNSNSPNNTPILDQNTANMVQLNDSSVLDGNLICVFDRFISGADNSLIFPLDQISSNFFLLFARGLPSSSGSGNLLMHSIIAGDSNYPMVSNTTFNLMNHKGAKAIGPMSFSFFFFFLFVVKILI